ncbi:transcriptional regulator [Zoogloea oryzae]|uniref:Transcriptional regulator n=1 Tax=Zoogloea oryzae TaxID=310767 RepID=A0ABQ6FBD1_9RHOO|nr:transcriptional regulator [Zoogloea oryzae]
MECPAVTARRTATPDAVDDAPAPDAVAAQPWHLAASDAERVVAEFEHALICLCEAFGRYNMQGLAGVPGEMSFSGQDNMVLHIIQTLDRPKSLSDISRFMNRDDLANIQYSVRKLQKAGLIEKASDRSARGTTYRTTEDGREVVAAFVARRRDLVLAPAEEMEQLREQLRGATKVMSHFIGLYDQAARVLTTRS